MPQPPWMPPAWTELGQRESPGAATNPRIADFFRRAGHPAITSDETAWCAAFVGACLEAAGIASTRSLRARSYLDWGVATVTPSLGAITVLARDDDPALGHVGFLIGETGSHVILLGGNQSDAVTVASFDRRLVLGYRLPGPAEIPSPAIPGNEPVLAEPRAFAEALPLILDFEGGWTDDPFDPGGPTNHGITLATFARERGIEVTAETVTDLKADLRRITDAEVRRIYLERYWRLARCDAMPAALALVHFDASVNQGVTGAARMLQAALDVTVDGEIGPITLAAANSCELGPAIDRYAAIRRDHYRSLSHFWRFGRGWLRRVERATAAAHALAAGRPQASATTPPSTKPGKPMMSDLPNPAAPSSPSSQTAAQSGTRPSSAESSQPGKWWGESLTIWGALLTAVTTVAPAIFAAFGIDMPAELLRTLGRDVATVIQAVGGLIGTVMTILGRIRATLPIERRTLLIRL